MTTRVVCYDDPMLRVSNGFPYALEMVVHDIHLIAGSYQGPHNYVLGLREREDDETVIMFGTWPELDEKQAGCSARYSVIMRIK